MRLWLRPHLRPWDGPRRIAGLAVGVLCELVAVAGCDSVRESSLGEDSAPGAEQSGFRVGNLLGGASTGFAQATQTREFHFPTDHGPHNNYRSEWWYLTLVLQSDDSSPRRFGGQFTLFRQASAPQLSPPQASDNPWRNRQFFMAHAAVTDVQQQEHLSAERFARGHPALAGVSAVPFAAWLDGWRLSSASGDAKQFLPLLLDVKTPTFTWQLRLSADAQRKTNVVLQGDAGLSRKGDGQASYYYSMPRLSVEGSLSVGAKNHQVVGTAWLDREWSTSVLGANQQGWDWFALRFNDGTDAMMFRLRRFDGERDPYDHGSLVSTQGEIRQLSVKDFELQPLTYWQDSQGDSWPVVWRIRLQDRTLIARAVVDDQLMRLSVRYWEGLVDLFEETATGTLGEQIGAGYMELTGYAQ